MRYGFIKAVKQKIPSDDGINYTVASKARIPTRAHSLTAVAMAGYIW